MEGDLHMGDGVVQIHSISIHSLRMEGDSPMRDCWIPLCLFQSTPSAWRETDFVRANCCHNIISIHSLRMEGDIYRMLRIQNKIISIHSLRMEGDAVYFADPVAIEEFQSTPSAWRETSG